ncbi:MAG: ComEA family DNA-binding protein [Thermomicrobiales bacterium]|nr:ComEA family DNA-binding protein [Thermomicrobiales bacterium]
MPPASPKTPTADLWKKSALWVLGLVAIISLATFFTFVIIDWQRSPQITFLATPNAQIAVDMRGAISTPGVVYLEPGARLVDAIDASGGLSGDADKSLINLASRVNDGQMITIPTQSPAGSSDQSGLININTASATELMSLPGIGEVTAGRIIAYRETNGPFQTIDDLTKVDGISTATVDAIRNLITVSGGD